MVRTFGHDAIEPVSLPDRPAPSAAAKANAGDSAAATLIGNQWLVNEDPISLPQPVAEPPGPQPPPPVEPVVELDGRTSSTASSRALTQRTGRRAPSSSSLFGGQSSLTCALPSLVFLAGTIAGAVVLIEKGSGEHTAFRCDFAGMSLSAGTFLVFVGLLVMELGFSKEKSQRCRWLAPLELVLAVNAAGLITLALLGHATWAIVQIFAVVAACSWTVVCCSLTALAWRRGVPAPSDGETNLMAFLLGLPACSAVACWILFVGVGYAAMYFKPMDLAGFSDRIGRLEHFLMLAVGGIFISTLCTWMGLSLHHSGRRLLLFKGERVTDLGCLRIFGRALALSFGAHFLAGAFIAFLFNLVIVSFSVLLARLAVRGARSPPKQADSDARSSVTGSVSSEELRGRIKKRKCREKLTDWLLTAVFLLFALSRVVAIFLVFFFDITFIQSYMLGTNQRDFVLAGRGLSCGTTGALVLTNAEDAAACTHSVVLQQGAPAFLLGTGGDCYAQELDVTFAAYADFRRGSPQGNTTCPGNQGLWQDTPGYDFYVLAPSCQPHRRLLSPETNGEGRRLSPEEMIATVYRFDFVFHLGEAARNLAGHWLQVFVDRYTNFLRTVMDFGNLRIPQEFGMKCTGFRRLISACMVLGAIMIVVTLTSMDLLGIMAASNEIAKIRAARLESFHAYLLMMTRAALLRQLVLLMLQVTISWGAKLIRETYGVFVLTCGYLVEDDNLSGTACPNFWHVPIDILASGLLFAGVLLGTATFFVVMSGSLYGLLPAQWAVKALFGQDLAVARIGGSSMEDGRRPGGGDGPVKPGAAGKMAFLLRPWWGLGISLGVWSTGSCRNYVCGQRQDWYEPLPDHDAEADDPRAAGRADLVDFKSMYEATAHNISIVWLPVPLVGAIMSKGTMYLNNYVIFSFGEDGGGTDRKPQRLSHHFQEDASRLVHYFHWALSAALFFMILAINCDFFGVQDGARLAVLSVCLAVVFAIAVLRVVVDLVKEIAVFRQGKHFVRSCKRVVEDTSTYPDGVIVQTAKFRRGDARENPLEHLPSCERQHLLRAERACKDLEELSWVREKRLPKDVMSRLLSAKHRLGSQSRALKRLLDAGEEPQDALAEAVLRAGTILYIHQAVWHEICAHRSRTAAQQRAKLAIHEAARAAGKELEQLATAEASAQAARIASARVATYQANRDMAASQRRLRPADGKMIPVPMEPPRKLFLEFEACSRGTSRFTAHLPEEHGGRELIDSQEAEAVVVVSGRVEMHWPQGKDHASFRPGDVQVKTVRHQILGLGDADVDSPTSLEEVVIMKTSSLDYGGGLGETIRPNISDGSDWLCGLCVQEDAQQPCCTAAFRSGTASSCLESWQLTDLGVSWAQAEVAGRLDDGGSQDSRPRQPPTSEGSPDRTLSSEGGARSSFVIKRVSPEPQEFMPAETHEAKKTEDLIESLEAALRDSVNNPQTLAHAAAFMNVLCSERQHMGAEQAAKCSRLMGVASKIIRTQQRSTKGSEGSGRHEASPSPLDQAIDLTETDAEPMRSLPIETAAPVDMRISALESLREALARDDLSSDELSIAIDRARRADVDPLILAKAEDRFRILIQKQRAALRLAKAIESRMIQQLRDAIQDARRAGIQRWDFPDKAGKGMLRKAEDVLKEEENNVLDGLKAAIKHGGALQLRRCLEQVGAMGMEIVAASEAEVRELVAEAEGKLTAVGEKKRLIALLKMALTTGNAGLLKAAVEEVERCGSADGGISLDQAKKRLETLEKAGENFKEGIQEDFPQDGGRSTGSRDFGGVKAVAFKEDRHDGPGSAGSKRSTGSQDMEQVRASAALRAALFQEPPELQMLRLAVQQAKQARIVGEDLQRAEDLIVNLSDQEKALESLRKAAAARDLGDLTAAIKLCHEIGVDRRKLLTAVQQLMDEQAKVARIAGDHGLGCSVLADLERERRQLHNSILESYGGFRSICRIRPQASAVELPPSPRRRAPGVLFQRGDRHTLLVSRDGGSPRPMVFGAVFGQDCIQAEVFNDLRSLAQSAVDGYNVLIMAGGPPRSGKTYAMLGEATERRGVVPRMIDEIFHIRERDSWRANLDVDTQIVEVYDTRKMGDLLSRGMARAGVGPTVRLVPQGWDTPGAEDAQLVVVEGAVTRRAASKQELKRMVQDAYRTPATGQRARHTVLLVTLTRTNRATGAMTRSKLACADLAGLGQTAGQEVVASYKALESVFKALARGERRPPFRDHALTQVLQDCMGGSAKTVLLLTLPPSESSRGCADCFEAVSFATCARW